MGRAGRARKARLEQIGSLPCLLVVPGIARGGRDQHDAQDLIPPLAHFPPVPLVSHSNTRCVGRASGGFVQAWNAGAYPAEDLIGDRADPVGDFISPDRLSSLLPDQRGGVTYL